MSNIPGHQAINIYNRYAFFYLYPSILTIAVDKKTNKLLFGVQPISFQTLPWILSVTTIVLVCGLGSLIFLSIAPFLSITFKYEVYNIVYFTFLGLCCCFQIITTYTLIKHREIECGFNALLQHGQSRKIKQ